MARQTEGRAEPTVGFRLLSALPAFIEPKGLHFKALLREHSIPEARLDVCGRPSLYFGPGCFLLRAIEFVKIAMRFDLTQQFSPIPCRREFCGKLLNFALDKRSRFPGDFRPFF